MSYDVIITREGNNWLADVPSVPGAHTFARSLPSLMKSLREVIILMDDLDNDAEVNIETHYEIQDAAVAAAREVAKDREELAARERDVQRRTAAATRRLTRAGYSVRDVAQLTGVTPGRVSQIESEWAAKEG